MINNKNNFFSFSNLKLKKELLEVIKEIGYTKPTNIQIKCIPLYLKGCDILGIAKTGSGKTASYVLPILNCILLNSNLLQALVLVPTRELSIQISNYFKIFCKYIKFKVLSLYGGQKYNIQLIGLKDKPNIIVSTPGRLIDYLNRGLLNLNNIKYLVLDEADEMLRFGFLNDVKKILSYIKNKHQTSLFSATISNNIKNIASKFMFFPKEINLSFNNNNKIDNIPKNIKQYYCLIYFFKDKFNILVKFLEIEKFNAIIIFVRTKSYTIKLSNLLIKIGYSCAPLNGDMDQNLREKTIYNLRNNKISILVATDIASRGLDINNVDLIINYDLPMDIKSYIHRIGRTGRAEKIGKAILFIEKKELFFLNMLKNKINVFINKINIPNNKTILKKRINNIIIKIKNLYRKENILNNKFYLNILNTINNKLNIKNKIFLNLILLKMFYENNFIK